jgi:hypothetical protein
MARRCEFRTGPAADASRLALASEPWAHKGPERFLPGALTFLPREALRHVRLNPDSLDR